MYKFVYHQPCTSRWTSIGLTLESDSQELHSCEQHDLTEWVVVYYSTSHDVPKAKLSHMCEGNTMSESSRSTTGATQCWQEAERPKTGQQLWKQGDWFDFSVITRVAYNNDDVKTRVWYSTVRYPIVQYSLVQYGSIHWIWAFWHLTACKETL